MGEELSHLAPLCKGELLLQCEALPTIEGLSAEVLVKAERLVQREGQAPSPTKSEYDNSNARLCKHTQTLTPTKSGCDSSDAKP